jgi:pyruvate dehydrogenase E1 component beta subunit
MELDVGSAIDRAIELSMVENEDILLMGQDTPMLRAGLHARFGSDRVIGTPISEGACLGAAMGAAMEGLRPIVELYMVDFLAVGLDAVLNHIAKLAFFSNGAWTCPMVIRAPTGGGYGDGGQHGQSLWGMLGAIPGLTVVVPSTPADAFGLTRTALRHDGPVILMEPKLLAGDWLEFLGSLGRDAMEFDVPSGARGEVDERVEVPFGRAAIRRNGTDVTIASLAVGVHRALEAAERLGEEGIECEVIDVRSVRPLDVETIVTSVARTGRLLVVDEDYRELGLSGELAAVALEAGLTPTYARVCVEDTLPFARDREREALPHGAKIAAAVRDMLYPGGTKSSQA